MALLTKCFSYKKFDGNAIDAVNTAFNGTVNGASLVTGKINQGYSFDGDNDLISVNDAMNIMAGFTFNIWVKKAGFKGTTEHLFGAYNSGSPFNGWGISTISTTPKIRFWNGSVWTPSTVNFPSDNVFHMVTVTYNVTSVSFYVDAVFSNTVSISAFASYVGTSAYGARNDGAGVIAATLDEGAFFDPLTQTEITELYNGGAGLQYPFSAPTGGIEVFGQAVTKVFNQAISKVYTI